jgi:hypothetical protein
MNRSYFEALVECTKPGHEIIYHTGGLAYDREKAMNFGVIDDIAKAALQACEAGQVHLVQRYIGAHCFEYIAVKRPSPHTPFVWMGCYSQDPRKPA